MAARIKELEVELGRTQHQLQLLQQISRFMVREMSLPEILAGINKLLVEYLECDSCLIYLLHHQELVLCSSNQHPADAFGQVRLQLSEGLTGWVARERRLLAISREAFHDPRFKHFTVLPEDTFEAFLSAPIIARNRVVGVINLQHRHPHQHTGAEMETLTTVGEMIGALLLLARLEKAVDAAANLELLLPEVARA